MRQYLRTHRDRELSRRHNATLVKRLGSAAIGLAAVLVLSMQFAGCATGQLPSGVLSLRSHSYERSAERYPEMSRIASAFDSVAVPVPDQHERTRQLNLFAEVFELTRSDYVDQVPTTQLIDAAVNSMEGQREADPESGTRAPHKLMTLAMSDMLHALDPHSDYLSADDYQEMQVRTRGEFGGLGIEVTMEEGLIKVVAPIDDTPAAAAGVLAGDLITHVDNNPILGKTLAEAVDLMRGPIGSEVIISVLRGEEEQTLEIGIVRDMIRIQPVRAHLEDEIGYVRITTFNERTISGLRKALRRLESDHDGALSGIVLDLRNNPGGLLDQALDVSDAFLTEGEIVSTIGRGNKHVRRFTADSDDLSDGVPMMVLINSGSASASEIVSGALQDHGRATVIGTRSFGKGSVQTIIPVRSGGAVRLTTARYYTPSGNSIQLTGIRPDVTIASDDETEREREADLENALPAEENPLAIDAKTEATSLCPGAQQKEDPPLACALDMLRGASELAQTPISQ